MSEPGEGAQGAQNGVQGAPGGQGSPPPPLPPHGTAVISLNHGSNTVDPADFADPSQRREGCLLIRVHVPELNVHKCLQFPADQLVWDVKQQCLAALPKELKESFNYGLFSPPANGRAGKFLDEERRLGDYPFNGPVGYLELKYKRRVYKMLKVDERQLKSLHTRANLRRFLEHTVQGQTDKISKMCAKGLDPNFHCQDTGETPLSIATACARPGRVLIALVNGGALLDYRTRDGSTALHRAVEKDCLEAVRTLLELGASPNYRDGRGLTPLYGSVSRKTDPALCEALLHDHAMIGARDLQGWQEVHQACRNGLVQHLEHLLFYGADMDARNASGNTPLHVCAVNAQDACARMLLFRGAQRTAANYSSQTPYQVAVIAGNMELAEVIRSYSNQDIVPFRGPPRYNPKRRSAAFSPTGIPLLQSPGDFNQSEVASMFPGQSQTTSAIFPGQSQTTSVFPGQSQASSIDPDQSERSFGDAHAHIERFCEGERYFGERKGYFEGQKRYFEGQKRFYKGPPSPDPSERPFSSASSSLGSDRSHEDDVSLITDKSGGEGSESSGVGTAGSDFVSCVIGGQNSVVTVGAPLSQQQQHGLGGRHGNPNGGTVVCLEPYNAPQNASGHLSIQRGDVIEVTATTDCGLLEGVLARSGASGLFPAQCVQEVRLRQNTAPQNAPLQHHNNSNHHVIAAPHNGGERHYSATAPRIKKTPSCHQSGPRTIVLHRARRGFGFVLRGAKAASPLMALRPSARCPALQYLDDVDPGGAADVAGLKPGDFLLAINGTDVSGASHERVVELIRASGELVQMTVVSPSPGMNFPINQASQQQQHSDIDVNDMNIALGGNTNIGQHSQMTQYQQSMNGMIAASIKQHYATLPRKAGAFPPTPGVIPGGTLGRSGPAPAPPRRDPRTTLSVGRARAKSMVAGLEGGGEKSEQDLENSGGISTTKSSSAESVQQQQMSPHNNHHASPSNQSNHDEYAANQPRTASIRARPTSSRITAAELEELFQRQQSSGAQGNRVSTMMCSSRFQSGIDSSPPGSPHKPRVYASVAEMKRKGKASVRGKAVSVPRVELLHRDFHSSPDLVAGLTGPGNGAWHTWSARGHRSQENVHMPGTLTRPLPPPTHPPPPPPGGQMGQLVKVDISRGQSLEQEQNNGAPANNTQAPQEVTSPDVCDSNAVMSSFRPASSAKLYASPQDIRPVGYRAKQEQNRNQVRKSQSLRGAASVTSGKQDGGQAAASCNQQQNSNQYAQPIRKNSVNSARNETALPPPIPEPDYSMSESDGENDVTRVSVSQDNVTKHVHRIRVGGGQEMSNVAPMSTNVHQPEPTKQNNGDENGQAETSGNSNTSGSSTGSTSLAHSFSVDEIQRIRTRLKSSKSYPDDFLDKGKSGNGNNQANQPNREGMEEADNSSSGVSSDQELHCDAVNKARQSDQQQPKQNTSKQSPPLAKNHHNITTLPPAIGGGVANSVGGGVSANQQQGGVANTQPIGGFHGVRTMQRHNSLTRKQANSIAMNRIGGSRTLGRSAAERLGVDSSEQQKQKHHNSNSGTQVESQASRKLSSARQAVSLAQLPPPLEADCDEGADVFVPPPPEFVGGATAAPQQVLAPPPQFSDKLGGKGKVRIVGAVPKGNRLNSH